MSFDKGLLRNAVMIAIAATLFSACKKEGLNEKTAEPVSTQTVSSPDANDPDNSGITDTSSTAGGSSYDSIPAASGTAVQVQPPVSASAAIGFAMENGITTGGAGGKVIAVNSLAALKSAAALTSPAIIMISGTISGNEYVNVKSNKSLIGLPGTTLNGVSFNLYKVSNVIIQNLTMQNFQGSNDAITLKFSDHVWVDHCSFENTVDGLVDITQQSDYVTVSWSKFTGATKASLVGSGDEVTADKGRLHVTYHHNYFLNDLERSPSIRYGTAHVFNNYYQTTASYTNGYGIAARMGAVVRAENNYFDNIKGQPIRTLDPVPGYISGEKTNYYKNCGRNVIQTAASAWEPTYSYKAYLDPAIEVMNIVKAGAGAK